ncbi:choline dehydrogenase, partial [Mesorhizobium sp. M2D.F.Ca.ET.140.01.1.1]
GKDGPIVVSVVRRPPKLAQVFIEAMQELGYPHNPSYNAEPTEGVALSHVTQHMGTRFSAARGYLDPIKSRPNLKIITGAVARKVIFE